MKLRKALVPMLLVLLSGAVCALDLGNIRADEISIYVQDLETGKVLAEHRADAAANPASTMKLVTAFAAFRALGKDYRWTTHLKSNAPLNGDTLSGDIYWQGSGDPVLDQDGLVALQQQLRTRGIRKISGSLVLDRSLWGDVKNDKAFASDSAESFMTPPDPNSLAYKVVAVQGRRNASGALEWRTNPPLPEIPIDSAKVAVGQGTGACASVARHLHARYTGAALLLEGKLPESCLGQDVYVNMFSSQDFARRSFVNQWRAAGGEISDGLRTAPVPEGAATLATLRSKPLSAVLADMNKFSNNLIARTVFLTLGRSNKLDQALSRADAAVRLELAAAGVDASGLVLENGSGLSRQERVTAKMMGQLLEKAYFGADRQAFVDTLPIAGTDGTLKTRLKQAGGNLHLKTGTLKDVRALAGYWLGAQPKVVVVIINSPKAEGYLKDMDRLVSQIVLPGGKNWVNLRASCEIRRDA